MTSFKYWDAGTSTWKVLGAVPGPPGPPGPPGGPGPSTLETHIGPSAPSPRGDYTVWVDTDEPDPPLALGTGRWAANNNGAAAGAYVVWAVLNPHDQMDPNFYVYDAVSGKAVGTMIRVLIAGWYEASYGLLQTGAGTGRGDCALEKINTSKVQAHALDNSLTAGAGSYWKHQATAPVRLAIGEGVAVNNASGGVYAPGVGSAWSWLAMRFLGAS